MSLGRSDPPGSSVSTPRGHECESRVSCRELGGSHEGHRARLPAAPPHWLGTSGAAGAGTPSAAARGVHVSTPRAKPPAACCAPQTRQHTGQTRPRPSCRAWGGWLRPEGLAGKRAVSLALREKQAPGRRRRERRQWGGGARR